MYTNLVLEGCATKSFAYIGALLILQQKGILENITRFVGTSSGAILSTMIVLGYNPTEILDFLFLTNSHKLLESSYFSGFMNFRKYLGYYSHEKYRNWLRSIFIHKNININITFKELYDKSNKILIIAGTCLNKQTTHYYHYISNPDMLVVKALEISSCIPLIFEPIKWKNDILVDGGLSESFPIYILDENNIIPNTREKLVNYDPNKYSHNYSTLGIKIMTEDNDSTLNVHSIRELLFSIISIIQTQLERDNIRASYWNQTIKIVVPKNFSWNYIHIPNEQRLELVEYGKKYATDFLTKFPSEI